MTLAERLRSETRTHHNRAEDAMGLMNPDVSSARYIEILQAFQSFYSLLEPQLSRFREWSELECEIESRMGKLAKIEHDLKYFNTPARGPMPRLAIENFAQALGSMYVIEGSTLGGQVISKFLSGRFGYAPDSGADYFSGYGSETGKMWVSFKDIIARAEAAGVDQERVIEGAAKTFDYLTLLLYIQRNQATSSL